MLKPNYGRKEASANYKIMHAYGSGYFENEHSKGVHELLINGFTVRFIPHYNEDKYSFPPDLEQLIELHNAETDLANINELRIHSFFQSDLVFYASNTQNASPIQYQFDSDNSLNHRKGKCCLITRSGIPILSPNNLLWISDIGRGLDWGHQCKQKWR